MHKMWWINDVAKRRFEYLHSPPFCAQKKITNTDFPPYENYAMKITKFLPILFYQKYIHIEYNVHS